MYDLLKLIKLKELLPMNLLFASDPVILDADNYPVFIHLS